MGKVIWLASYPKSGNTWLRAFLHNLFRKPGEAYDINRLIDFCTSESALGWFIEVAGGPVKDMGMAEIAQLRPKVHRRLTQIFPDNVFAKTHNALVESHGVPTVTMEYSAGAIYVIRNPLDVVISFADHYGRSIDEAIEMMGRSGLTSGMTNKHVHEVLGSWSEHVESWTGRPNPGLHVMRYEDMLDRPQQVFGAVTRFLGLDPGEDRLHRAIEQSSFENLRRQEDAKGFVERSEASERFFRSGRAGQWRTVLTPAQVQAIAAAHEIQMRRFGYLPLPADYRPVAGAA